MLSRWSVNSQPPIRIALLHTRLSSYLAACLRELRRQIGAELLIYAYPPAGVAPFGPVAFAGLGEVRNRREHSDADIERTILEFQPDAALVSGWADKGYMKVCRALRKRGIPVIAGCDTQWKGSLRQQVASWTAPWHVQRSIDVLWVTGERQATLGRALGYHGDHLWDGYYACDWKLFASRSGEARRTENPKRDKPAPHFLYVGRHVPEKGIDTLVEAYRNYLERLANPWGLVIAGAGPLKSQLVNAGADDRGFVQPSDLPRLMAESSAFVLPSRFEPWGVVIHEAAASGLPLICSDACGAAVHLLRDSHNGFMFPTGDVEALADRMVAMTEMAEGRRVEWGRVSYELAKQYTPERWAETLVQGLQRIGVSFSEARGRMVR